MVVTMKGSPTGPISATTLNQREATRDDFGVYGGGHGGYFAQSNSATKATADMQVGGLTRDGVDYIQVNSNVEKRKAPMPNDMPGHVEPQRPTMLET